MLNSLPFGGLTLKLCWVLQGATSRPRRWVSKLHSRHTHERWAALLQAVPCLHPSHRFSKVVDGPEREVVFTGRHSTTDSDAVRPVEQPPKAAEEPSAGRGAAATSAAVAAAAAATASEGEQRPAEELAEGISQLTVGGSNGSVSRTEPQQQWRRQTWESGAVAAVHPSDLNSSRSCSPAERDPCASAQPCGREVASGSGGSSQGGSSQGGSGSSSSSRGELSEQLQAFLRTFPPSGASCRDVAWVNVVRPQAKGGSTWPGEERLPHIEVS